MKTKKILSAFLVLLLIFSAFSSIISAAPLNSFNHSGLSQLNATKRHLESSIAANPAAEGLKDSDTVRVIIELQDEPVIEYATEQGLKVTEMNHTSVEKITEHLVEAQTSVKNKIKADRLPVQYHQRFVNVVNGFSATTTYAAAKKIEKFQGVLRVLVVNQYNKPEPTVPDLDSSKDIIKARETWNLEGYNGEGTVVSVIDTGIDPSHKDMILTDSSKAKYSQDQINTLTSGKNLPGKFYTDKVPYGYNYADENNTILDLGPSASMHGMHVAGTIGANGDEQAGGIKGVAPETQLLAMKVFSNDPEVPTTSGDILIQAIDDSIALGADVINMSLGSTASYVAPDDPEQQAVTRAAKNGVFLAISAGNSAQITAGNNNSLGGDKPYAMNPDIGVVGAPGLTSESVQVASIENTKIHANVIDYAGGTAAYTSSGPDPVAAFGGKPVEFVDSGYGSKSDIPDSVSGKIALIQRGAAADGTANFVDKISNAQQKGAVGVVVYNNPTNGDNMITMAYPTDGTIPAVLIGRTDGLKILDLPVKEVSFLGNTAKITNPSAGKMSTFTSWGVTPELDFKPEITAPGGQIYSTLNNNSYGVMSGTSMASPHVAGGAALIIQRVNKEFPTLTGQAKVEMVKNLLMSTAQPHLQKDGILTSYLDSPNPTSPRRQGAGVMDLYSAASTPAIVTDGTTGISKVALKEIGNVTEFPITVTNFSNEEVAYNVSGIVGTDFVLGPDDFAIQNQLEMDQVIDSDTGESPIYFTNADGTPVDNSVVVPANGTITLHAKIDLTNAVDWAYEAPLNELFDNGTFIEGFIKLVPETADVPTIGLPYLGFYGKWDQAPIIEEPALSESSTLPYYYGYTLLTWPDEAAGQYHFLGTGLGDDDEPSEEYVSFSPINKQFNTVQPLLSFIRNAKEVEVSIAVKDGDSYKVVRTLSKDKDIVKDYYDSGSQYATEFRTSSNWKWDGKIKGKVAADDQYYYLVKAKIDYPGAEWQTTILPVKVDTKPPVIQDFNLGSDNKTVTVSAVDETSSIYSYALVEDGKVLEENTTGVFDLSAYKGPHYLKVRASDYARNAVYSNEFLIGQDQGLPGVIMLSPDSDLFNTSEIEASGYVISAKLAELKINGQDVPFTLNPKTNNYDFTIQLNYTSSGVYKIDVTATGANGQSINFKRKIFVDISSPTISVGDVPSKVPNEVEEIELPLTVQDDFAGIRVSVDGDLVYSKEENWEYLTGVNPTTHVVDPTPVVSLEVGDNEFTVEAEDEAGNVSTSTIHVYRAAPGEVVDPGTPGGGNDDGGTPDGGDDDGGTPGGGSPGGGYTDGSSGNIDNVTPANNIKVGSFTTSDKSATAKVSSDIITNQINSTGNVSLDLSDIKFVDFNDVAVTFDKATADKLVASGKALTLSADGFAVEIPAAALADFISEDGFKLNITVSGDGNGIVQNSSSGKTSVVSQVVTLSNTSGKLNKPINVILKPDTKQVSDLQKVGAYYKGNKNSAWTYVGFNSTRQNGDINLATSDLGTFAAIEYKATFADTVNHWAKNEIEVIAAQHVSNGRSETQFAPNDTITRAEFTALLDRTLGNEKAWSQYAAIKGAKNVLSREEMVVLIVNALGVDLTDVQSALTFKDKARISTSAQAAVAYAVDNGLIKGMDGNKFAPDQTSTRGQAAVILYRLLKFTNKI